MYSQVLIAGFGGQGVLTCGQVLALAATLEGRHVTWMPSYGPEQRGGTASCVVTISDRRIGSPLVENLSTALVFNNPSLVKFEPQLSEGGLLILNSSMVKTDPVRGDLIVHRVPADEIAGEAGMRRASNIVMLGAYLAAGSVVSLDAALEAILKYLGPTKQHLVEVNRNALAAGWNFIAGITSALPAWSPFAVDPASYRDGLRANLSLAMQ
jgi:2-oxoglutarate ferredoxin oxidoreductase subunit gamma